MVFNPELGDQEYVAAPLAMIESESPRQTIEGSGLNVMTGSGFTSRLVVINESQPLTLVSVSM